MNKQTIRSVILAVVAMIAVMSVAFAQYAPSLPPLRPILSTPRPLPQATLTANPRGTTVPDIRGVGGRLVPLSQLPPLPPRNANNTATPGRRARPMAATGATITVTRANNSATGNCANTSGTLYNIGCTVDWRSSGNNTGHTYKDYYIAPNVANGQAGTLVQTYTGTTSSTHSLTLSAEGTYVFATLDSTSNVWMSVVYITVGSSFQVKVYQDAYHTTETYQFDASTSGAAYIYGTNLTPSDYYVVYIESTSVNPQCQFMAPGGTITAGQLCNVSGVAGVQAPGGTLGFTWPITTAIAAGTYSVVVYDKTLNERLGQVQVTVTGSSGYVMTLNPDDTNANPSPNPLPAATPTPSTVFAYDSANDRSTGGLTMTVTHAPSSTYIWSVTDPNGYTYASSSVAGSGTMSNTFNFSNFALSPGTYQPKTFSAALYDTVSKTVYAAQTFQMYGYYVVPSLDGGSALSVSQGGSTAATLQFTNESDVRYGSDHADSISKIIFTTGGDFVTTSGNGQGIFAYLNGKSFAGCASPGCTGTVTDSAGATWNITNICGNGGSQGTDECTIELDPAVATTTLAPGAYISIANVHFGNATGSNCSSGNTCTMYTSILPAHGQTWSNTSASDAFLPVYIAAGNSLTGTASVALSGTNGPSYISGSAETVEAHLYEPYTTHAHYHRGSPYTMTSSYYNIIAFTLTNNSSKNEDVVAIGLPGSYASLGSLDNFALDPNLNTGSNANWVIDTSCSTAAGTFGRKWLCLDGTGTYNFATANVPKNGSTTIYLDMNAAPTAFTYTDWAVELADPLVFNLTADAAKSATIPVGPGGTNFTVDALAYAQYSLDSSLMQANFNPSTTGSNTSASESVQITNTATGADPYPDYLDNVLFALPSTYTLTGVTVSTTGWSLLSSTPITSGGYKYYWFSACNNGQNVSGNLPPTTTPLTAKNAGLTTQCSAATRANALAPGASLTFAGTITGVGSSNITALMYGHGANGNGWTQSKSFTLGVQSTSASAGFSAAGGYPTPAPVATNAVPSIGGNASATYGNAYTYSVKNTSGSGNITSFAIIVPGLDLSGNNATDSSGNAWVLTNTPPTLSGNTDGCTVVGYQSATTAGADGYIDIGGGSCALVPGDTIKVNFDATGPQSQGDSYTFPMQNINGTGTLNSTSAPGTTGAETWLGDQRVQVQLTIGLNLAVNPSNPGPGGSTPVVSCGGCAFSGTTVDFGTYGASTTTNFTDIVDASVYITSATAITWNLSVQTNSNPARTPSTPTNELLTWTDNANSSSAAGITFDVTSATVVPTATSLQVAHGTSITTRSTPYDVLQSYQLNLGTETSNSSVSTVTYTLVAN